MLGKMLAREASVGAYLYDPGQEKPRAKMLGKMLAQEDYTGAHLRDLGQGKLSAKDPAKCWLGSPIQKHTSVTWVAGPMEVNIRPNE
jgi:hypothetical protein